MPVVDTTAITKGSADATKLVKIEADGLNAAQTCTITASGDSVDFTPGSGIVWTVESIAVATVLTGSNKKIVCDTTGGAFIVELPGVASNAGARFTIKDSGNGATASITVDGKLAQEIDGELTQVINTDYGSISVFCDGAKWLIE